MSQALNITLGEGERWEPRSYRTLIEQAEDISVSITLAERAEARLHMCDYSAADTEAEQHTERRITLAPHSHLELYDIEETHSGCKRTVDTEVHVGEGATLLLHTTTLRGGQTQTNTRVILDGPGAEVWLYGCVIADAEQSTEHRTLIHHKAPRCRSTQTYKYVLDGSARGLFEGRILVSEGADGTESNEVNANLLASPEARMLTRPELEIYADDVKCSHGSTVGQLSDDALFYMRQRGLSEAEARTLLKQAFLAEVIDGITLKPLADNLRLLVERRLSGTDDKCQACKKPCKR